jgi:hypothetical protein
VILRHDEFFIAQETVDVQQSEMVRLRDVKKALVLDDEIIICIRARSRFFGKSECQVLEYRLTGEPGSRRSIRPDPTVFVEREIDFDEKMQVAALEQEQTLIICSVKEKEVEIQKISKNS